MSLQSQARHWLDHERFRSVAAVALHISVALIVTLVNKACLNIAPLPCALLFVQSITIVSLITLGGKLRLCKVRNLTNDEWRNLSFYLFARAASQLSKLFCLRYVDAAFYQVVRGLLIPCTVALSLAILPGWKISATALAGCAAIVVGFFVGVEGETVASTPSIGLVLGVLSSFATAAETVLVKLFLASTDIGILDTACAAATINVPFSALLSVMTQEGETLREMVSSGQVTLLKTASAYLASSIVTFVLALATLLQITITSPLTHMISTAFRGVLQAGMAVAIFKSEHLGRTRTVSLAIIVGGTVLYSYGKDRELRRKALQAVDPSVVPDPSNQQLPRKSSSAGAAYELVNRDEASSLELARPLTANDRQQLNLGELEKRTS